MKKQPYFLSILLFITGCATTSPPVYDNLLYQLCRHDKALMNRLLTANLLDNNTAKFGSPAPYPEQESPPYDYHAPGYYQFGPARPNISDPYAAWYHYGYYPLYPYSHYYPGSYQYYYDDNDLRGYLNERSGPPSLKEVLTDVQETIHNRRRQRREDVAEAHARLQNALEQCRSARSEQKLLNRERRRAPRRYFPSSHAPPQDGGFTSNRHQPFGGGFFRSRRGR
ncbi:MAG: hypothetical protein GY850_28885 [bacterium]|nr:hypothetical protein [bacterium]